MITTERPQSAPAAAPPAEAEDWRLPDSQEEHPAAPPAGKRPALPGRRPRRTYVRNSPSAARAARARHARTLAASHGTHHSSLITHHSLAWEAVLVGLALALVAVFFVSLRWYGFDLLEEGYFLTNARVVQHGGLPYRDFDTPYTPGVFYLYAYLMDRVGPDLLALRTMQVAGRVVTYVALYLCGRQLLPPFFAALAPAMILVMDVAPELWGIHPGWYAAPATILGVLAVARYLRTGRARWLFASGVASGVAFLFKQNLAAYGVVAALWMLVVAGEHLPPVALPGVLSWLPRVLLGWAPAWLLRVTMRTVQVFALLLLPLVAAVITRPYWSPLVIVLFTVPLAGLSAFAAARLLRDEGRRTKDEGRKTNPLPFVLRPLLLLAGFALVIVPAMVAMLNALHWELQYLGPVVGKVDPTGYFYGMQPPTWEHVAKVGLALAAPVMVGAVAMHGWWGRRGAALALAGVLGWAVYRMAVPAGFAEPWSLVRGGFDVAGWLGTAWQQYGEQAHTATDLVLYLPAIAFWASFAVLNAKGTMQSAKGWGVLHFDFCLLHWWYLAAGTAIFLNQYPRMDEIHWLWSSGVLLVSGAAVLYAWHRHALRVTPRLARSGAARVAFRWSLMALPLVAVFPRLWWRLDTWQALVPAPPAITHAATLSGRAEFVPLPLPGTSEAVWIPENDFRDITEVVDLLADRTAPGEPIFTYPAIPGFYFLADRPNATRFNHLFEGMASPGDQQEIVRQLERVRYIVWDDGGAHFWVQPGMNALITEYIRTHYRVERFIGPYAVLSREARGPALNYFPPAPPPRAPNTATANAGSAGSAGTNQG